MRGEISSAHIIMKKRKLILAISFLITILLLSVLYFFSSKEDKNITDLIRDEKNCSYVKLSRGTVNYELSGTNVEETIVLVHGGTIPMFSFDRQFYSFVDDSFQVLRYDQYGRGFSDRPDILYNKELYVEQLHELLDSLKIMHPVDIVGHSFGGSIAVAFTSKYPERVNRIILFSPLINGITNMTPIRIVRFPILGNIVGRFLILPLSLNRVNNFFNGSIDTLSHYRKLCKEQMSFKGFEKSLFSMMKSDAMRDYHEEFKKIGNQNKEVLIIWGNKDKTVSEAMIKDIKQTLSNHKFMEIDNGSHSLNFKQPEKFNSIITSFLKKESL